MNGADFVKELQKIAKWGCDHTGGGCMAHVATAQDGVCIVICDQSLRYLPDVEDLDVVQVGIYASRDWDWYDTLLQHDWEIPAADAIEMAKAFFAHVGPRWSTNDLCNEYNAWLDANGLEGRSADEWTDGDNLTVDQDDWLRGFIGRWDIACMDERAK